MTRALPNLSDTAYWERVQQRAAELESDGCSGVPNFYLLACLEHDIHYRTHRTLYDEPITRAEADARFRQVIQMLSVLGQLSPMSWWRWAAVRLFGGTSWQSS